MRAIFRYSSFKGSVLHGTFHAQTPAITSPSTSINYNGIESSILFPFYARAYKHKYTPIRTFLSDKDRVQNFVTLLDSEERKLLLDELNRQERQQHQGNNDKSQHVTTTNQNQTSPSSTLINGSNEPHHHLAPSLAQLQALAIHQALPFIGFGFLDNLIMIIAGDYIDLTLGISFGISTMAAAGLGNAISDVAGVGSAYYVERISAKLGIKTPNLSLTQIQMPRTRWATQIGRAIGVTIGCIIGMFPLLFIPNKNDLKICEETETN